MKPVQLVVAFVLVAILHGGVVLAALHWSSPPVMEAPPTISGVLIQAPPAEVVQIPRQVTKPRPEKVKPQKTPTPGPKSKPSPPPSKPPPPKPLLPPVETAISTPVPEVKETIVPEPVESALATDTLANDSLGAPVTPPRVDAHRLNNPAPAYPSISRRRGEEGVVLLEMLVLADGQVTDVHVKQSSGYPRLDQSAMNAVQRWRYSPATKSGVAIEYRYLQPVKFALRN